MKSNLRSFFAMGLFLTAGWSFAQSVSADLHLKVNIPFAFTVNRTTLPAGQYTVRSFGASDGKTLLIQSSDSRWATSIRTHGVEAAKIPQQCKLRFLTYGDKHFLWEIWTPGNPSGYQLPKNSEAIELEIAHQGGALDLVAQRPH